VEKVQQPHEEKNYLEKFDCKVKIKKTEILGDREKYARFLQNYRKNHRNLTAANQKC